ncbi:CDP-diacylglycerol--glycerol-3-phosphate 3-phosphatidyltransferase, mitochondrial-like isoform X2 [Dreissena polymorpha]|nr:CDP-diacylglycerol--glycerol-3-phosphate 3-phosphatidyltransferase, mitochondrial-like isoform X2 [Dreissena polymorpha]XP_052240440.1 CDP-diacylglycerol--glycerol-3-phosphate 3-phosphatidyltransferase, mitochondrial-like isoform X2 [Dreissena polymorpha]
MVDNNPDNYPNMSHPTMSAAAQNLDIIKQKFLWISDHVPCFGIRGDNITVIKEPVEFYKTVMDMFAQAQHRIVIASLYLGTGVLEKQLVQSIETACEQAVVSGNTDFQVHILLDFNRGTRGGHSSSRSMLLPLVQKYKDLVHVHLYHTPDLRGLVRRYLPERINETVGLNHMKIYLADDDFVISGANLSDSYFTDRQDRYIAFRQCRHMADYWRDIVTSTARFSFQLQGDNSVTYPTSSPHPYEGPDGGKEFKHFAHQCITSVNKTWNTRTDSSSFCDQSSIERTGYDTWLFPLIQMGPFQIGDDEFVTEQLFRKAQSSDKLVLASGYFNLTRNYLDVILKESSGNFDILTASPEANGFHGATGISQYIPAVYTLIASQFHGEVRHAKQEERIALYEYSRPYWTFHGKGLWYYVDPSRFPVLTLIGSPNFGYRSVYRDLECQVAVVTANPALQLQLKQENDRLSEQCEAVTEATFQHADRAVPLIPRLFTSIIKHYF